MKTINVCYDEQGIIFCGTQLNEWCADCLNKNKMEKVFIYQAKIQINSQDSREMEVEDEK